MNPIQNLISGDDRKNAPEATDGIFPTLSPHGVVGGPKN